MKVKLKSGALVDLLREEPEPGLFTIEPHIEEQALNSLRAIVSSYPMETRPVDDYSLMPFTWARFGGYEVSSKGDSRYSAFNAYLPDGRSIEQHYQCDVKGYDPGGLNWKLGKGKPPLNRDLDLASCYLALWRTWSQTNMDEMRQLFRAVRSHGDGCTLSDRFATTPVNQAWALSVILNELADCR